MKKPFFTEIKIFVIAIIMILPIYHHVRPDWVMSGGGGLAIYVLSLLIGFFVSTMSIAISDEKDKDFLKTLKDPLQIFLAYPFIGGFIVMMSAGVYIFFDEILPLLIEIIF